MRDFPRNPRQLFILIVLAMMAMLLRWNGVVVILTGVMLLWWWRGTVQAVVFASLASIAPGAWLFQNWLLTGHPMGVRIQPPHTAFDVALDYAGVLIPWIVLFMVMYGILSIPGAVSRVHVLQQRHNVD
jgi:hypothetical protein